MKLAAAAFTLLLIGTVGCKDDPIEAYATYQECFDEHTTKEMLPTKETIVVCCLEHPINGISPACGDIKADCINYLTANLNQTSASTTDVMDACADYVSQKNMP
jgi:hypothetical protein